MRKEEGSYQQYRPNLTINDEKIPAELGVFFQILRQTIRVRKRFNRGKSPHGEPTKVVLEYYLALKYQGTA